MSEVTPLWDQGKFAAYSTQRIGGVKRKNGGCVTCGMFPGFAEAGGSWAPSFALAEIGLILTGLPSRGMVAAIFPSTRTSGI